MHTLLTWQSYLWKFNLKMHLRARQSLKFPHQHSYSCVVPSPWVAAGPWHTSSEWYGEGDGMLFLRLGCRNSFHKQRSWFKETETQGGDIIQQNEWPAPGLGNRSLRCHAWDEQLGTQLCCALWRDQGPPIPQSPWGPCYLTLEADARNEGMEKDLTRA
jgi:hypothetical protein